ncbi:MAG: DegV family protein, partial [Eggerthellaceae bacterium]|nr:DegV family protein [Eggerthellaceae bacterium]
MIRIITDSAASLPFDVAKAHNIEVIPMFINWQSKEYVASEMD